ncbi:hypothetical protein UPYG_G00097920 [Umbra pygmaea]|uniref:Uncharacterized protein n=1 Tax=Umbra pygmaea TaxID=75934 RepID=A0ABD0X470_UMBPY
MEHIDPQNVRIILQPVHQQPTATLQQLPDVISHSLIRRGHIKRALPYNSKTRWSEFPITCLDPACKRNSSVYRSLPVRLPEALSCPACPRPGGTDDDPECPDAPGHHEYHDHVSHQLSWLFQPPPSPEPSRTPVIQQEDEEELEEHHHHYQPAPAYLPYPTWGPQPRPHPSLVYHSQPEPPGLGHRSPPRDILRRAVPPPPPTSASRPVVTDV